METKMEEMLVSSWFNLHSSVPSSYVQSPERRPEKLLVASGKTIPVIDLGGHHHPPRDTLILILKASQEYGFFQVIHHGVSEELMEDTLNIFKEFHVMHPKEKMTESSKDPKGTCKLYTSREVTEKKLFNIGGIHLDIVALLLENTWGFGHRNQQDTKKLLENTHKN